MADQQQQQQEKVFTIPFRNVLCAPQRARADRAVTEVRAFISRHLKVPVASVKVGVALNEKLWENGAKEIPKKLKIHAKKVDESTLVELADVPFPAGTSEKKEKKKIKEPAAAPNPEKKL
ncbi:MAG: 50S ribosomal protein L31e [archaeon]